MCGIVGYIGPREASPILMSGLKRLEYRGYDSSGLAIIGADGSLDVRKREGKLSQLEALVAGTASAPAGQVGIGHTRWATHGPPNTTNAHPHFDEEQRIALVHNGIIENYAELRLMLKAKGHIFSTDTDTEVLAHLIEDLLYGGTASDSGASDSGPTDSSRMNGNAQVNTKNDTNNSSPKAVDEAAFLRALQTALGQAHGAYGLAIVCRDVPDRIFVARQFSPLVIGLGDGETFLGSDIPALLDHTRRMLLLEDGEIAVLSQDGASIYDLEGRPIQRQPIQIDWDAARAEKGGYEHFVRKEIDEQPQALTDTLRGRVENSEIQLPELDALDLDGISRVYLVACGTSFYAGLIAKGLIERWARLPVEVAIASELRYGDPVLSPDSLVILVTQSGETADTLAAMRRAKDADAPTLAITNVLGSSVTRGADATLYLQVGPEIGVVATKTFTGQLAVLTLLAAELGRRRGKLQASDIASITDELLLVPETMKTAIADEPAIKEAALSLIDARSIFFIGRGFNHPIALEAALKLKEISYIHAEGYPAGELKHGPLAMLEPGIPVVAFATQSPVYEKVVSNIEEIRARGSEVLAIATQGDEQIQSIADRVLYVPSLREELMPFVCSVPAQLLGLPRFPRPWSRPSTNRATSLRV